MVFVGWECDELVREIGGGLVVVGVDDVKEGVGDDVGDVDGDGERVGVDIREVRVGVVWIVMG